MLELLLLFDELAKRRRGRAPASEAQDAFSEPLEPEEQEQHGFVAHWLEKIGIHHLTWKPVTAAAFTMIMAVAGGLYVVNGPSRGASHATLQAACPVVDLQALDQNQQVLNALQDLDDDSSNNSPAQVNE